MISCDSRTIYSFIVESGSGFAALGINLTANPYDLDTNELAPTKHPSASFTPFLIVELTPKSTSDPVVTDPPNVVLAAIIFLDPIKHECAM